MNPSPGLCPVPKPNSELASRPRLATKPRTCATQISRYEATMHTLAGLRGFELAWGLFPVKDFRLDCPVGVGKGPKFASRGVFAVGGGFSPILLSFGAILMLLCDCYLYSWARRILRFGSSRAETRKAERGGVGRAPSDLLFEFIEGEFFLITA